LIWEIGLGIEPAYDHDISRGIFAVLGAPPRLGFLRRLAMIAPDHRRMIAAGLLKPVKSMPNVHA
jgi:hypothetical protein